jgi:hypothetical protein
LTIMVSIIMHNVTKAVRASERPFLLRPVHRRPATP